MWPFTSHLLRGVRRQSTLHSRLIDYCERERLCRRNSVAFDTSTRPLISCSWYDVFRKWQGRRKLPCTCAFSTSPKPITPSAEPFCGLCYSSSLCRPPRVLVVIRQFHDDMRAYDTCEWMVVSTRICSNWSRVSGRGICSHHFYSTCLAVLCVAGKCFLAEAAIMDVVVQLQRTTENGGKEQATAGKIRRTGNGGRGPGVVEHTVR